MSKIPGIKLAETDRVDELKEYVDELLDIINHPGALITDRSVLWDFFGNDREPIEELSFRLDFKVYKNTYLVDIAEEMKRVGNQPLPPEEPKVFEVEFIYGDCIPTCLNCFGGIYGTGCICLNPKMSACYAHIQQAKKIRNPLQ